jgi:pimeloyl-ACP methyl ester carboxylesterase
MEQSKIYKEIDDYEAGILSYVNIKPGDYRKANLKYINVHYLEFNWQKKQGPTVLLLHGYGASSITYFKIIPGTHHPLSTPCCSLYPPILLLEESS